MSRSVLMKCTVSDRWSTISLQCSCIWTQCQKSSCSQFRQKVKCTTPGQKPRALTHTHTHTHTRYRPKALFLLTLYIGLILSMLYILYKHNINNANTKHIRLLHVDKYVNKVKCVPAPNATSQRHACSNYYLKKTHTI